MRIRWVRNIGSISLSVLLFASVFVIVNSASYSEAAEQEGLENSSTGITALASSDSGEVAAASGPNRFVVWTDDTPGNPEILFKRSTDNGATWQPVKNLSNNAGDSSSPQIAVSGSNVYVTWLDFTPGNHDVMFRRSGDNGATWKSVVNLSKNPGDSFNPKIAVSGTNVYVVWDQRNVDFTQSEIFFRRSTDNGATWKLSVNLSNNPGFSIEPQIAVSGSNVYVVWDQSNVGQSLVDVFFRRSTDNGATWKIVKNLSSNGHSSDPDLAVLGSNVYVVWTWYGGGEIFFQRSTDNGATWKSAKNVSNNPGASLLAKIAISDPNVYVVWTQDNADETHESVFFRRSTDNGGTWKPILNFFERGWTGECTLRPQVAASGSNAYVIWVDDEACNLGLLLRRSTDNGATWKLSVNLSNNPGGSIEPQVAVFGSNVYLVWAGRDIDYETFFRRSVNNGETWKPTINLSNNSGASGSPQIAV